MRASDPSSWALNHCPMVLSHTQPKTRRIQSCRATPRGQALYCHLHANHLTEIHVPLEVNLPSWCYWLCFPEGGTQAHQAHALCALPTTGAHKSAARPTAVDSGRRDPRRNSSSGPRQTTPQVSQTRQPRLGLGDVGVALSPWWAPSHTGLVQGQGSPKNKCPVWLAEEISGIQSPCKRPRPFYVRSQKGGNLPLLRICITRANSSKM